MSEVKDGFGWLAASFVVVLIASCLWIQRNHTATPENAVREADSGPKYAEQQQAGQTVAVSGPTADSGLHSKAGEVVTLQPISSPAPQHGSERPSKFDHVSYETPVGTRMPLLHQTFNVATIVDLPFDLPAHASTPNLRGTYQAFLPKGSRHADADDDAAAVEFMVLNEQQFADLLSARPIEAVFSADATTNGEVNLSMPPTFTQPVKYHLVFGNGSRDTGKKVVQADFRIDF